MIRPRAATPATPQFQEKHMMRNPTLLPVLAIGLALSTEAPAQATATASATTKVSARPVFEAPVRLEAGSKLIQTEKPGYASPAWADRTCDQMITPQRIHPVHRIIRGGFMRYSPLE